MNKRFLSCLLILLLLLSVPVPIVSAEIPDMYEVNFDGGIFMMDSYVLVDIGQNLGIAWDGVDEHWENFVSDVEQGLDNLIHAKTWIAVRSNEGKALIKTVDGCYSSGGGSGEKKDYRWYFETRLYNGQIEVNSARVDEDQAIEEMGHSKNILTLNIGLARDLVGRFKGLTKEESDTQAFKGEHYPEDGVLHHLHYYVHGIRLCCWSWY